MILLATISPFAVGTIVVCAVIFAAFVFITSNS
jgi:hypothetical protein